MNPSTGEQIAAAPVCLPDRVDSAVQAAKAAYPAWSSQPVGVRTQVLFRFRELVNQHFEELSVLLATEMGKKLDESRGDVHKVVEACEVAVSAPMEIQGYAMMEATRSHDICLYRESVGVFLGIAPYNFPAMIPFGWFLPLCIVAGTTMVLKAASMVPQTACACSNCLIEAGLPKGVVNLVTCSRQEVANLLSIPTSGASPSSAPPQPEPRSIPARHRGRQAGAVPGPRPKTTLCCWRTPPWNGRPSASSTPVSAAPASAAWPCPWWWSRNRWPIGSCRFSKAWANG